MTLSQLAFVGDSLTKGDADALSAIGDGGKGTFVELVAELLAALPSIGPLVSAGIQGAWLTGGVYGWSRAGTWTDVVSTDAFDKTPYGLGAYASGSTKTMTWTKPSQWRALHGVAIYWVDYSGGGNWRYRKDGGAWVNHGQTALNDNAICKFYVTGNFTTLDIQASSDGSASVGCYPFAVEPFFLAPSTSQGLIVHNFGTGGVSLHNLVLATSGDRMAILDTVRLGTGSPIASTPHAGVSMMHINDATQLNNTTTWATDLTTFNTRVSPLGPVGFVNPWEIDPTVVSATIQANYRAQTKTTGATLSAKVVDLYDAWAANGWTGNAAALSAGLLTILLGKSTHQSQAGNIDLTPRVYWHVRQKLLALGNLPTLYPVKATKAATVYAGTRAAVAHSAGLPVAVA
jgi:hypothetical protein